MAASRSLKIAGALLLSAVVLVGVGCAGNRSQVVLPREPTAAAESTIAVATSVDATGPSTSPTGAAQPTPTASGSAKSAGSSSGSGRGLSATDAKELDAELSAIESELDRMSLPSDSDFGSLESGLK